MWQKRSWEDPPTMIKFKALYTCWEVEVEEKQVKVAKEKGGKVKVGVKVAHVKMVQS